ncbi:LOW QUALITY PROTEIN: uncharacterized protein Dyak_GE17222 [Drosophila yakuba]|uniref:ABC transporter domain-containing protein n=1 Tax=Drosophila yakuba TaxID=7245 RepID=A0A0R1EA83_DROYA|nr:LOW QUALITY PROTEIN: uncharacterized protein Dyak_GE17222 [Drosophila yakuba]
MPCQICHVFWLLVWKNFQKQKDNKLVLFLSLVLPVMSSLFLLLTRSSSDFNMRDYSIRAEAELLEFSWSSLIDKVNERRAKMVNKQRNFTTNVFIPNIQVAFAPNSNAALRKLMGDALGRLSIPKDKIADFGNCNDMRTHAASEHYLASVCFRNVDDSLNGLPAVLHFAIILPSELRNYERTWIGDSWKETSTLMDRVDDEDNEFDANGYTDYMEEGFVSLQYYISMEFLRSTASNVEKLPKVLMRRFNENPNVLLSEEIGTAVILLILLGFMFPVAILVALIVKERELGQRYVMELLNASATLQMAAWFFSVFIHFLITFILITILLKIQWNGAMAAMNKCPWSILLFFLTSYGFSVSSLIILMATVIRRSRVAIVMVPIIWILLALPLLSKKELLSDGPNVFYGFATVFLCNVSLSRGLSKIFYIEDYTLDVTIGKYLLYKVSKSDFGLVVPIVCFYAQTIFCILLALFLENNAYVWLALRIRKLLKRSPAIKSAVDRLAPEIPAVSSPKTPAKAVIEFRGVWQKYFRSTFVVQDFTLNVYSGEVVALLGHNSSWGFAGKAELMVAREGVCQKLGGNRGWKKQIDITTYIYDYEYTNSLLSDVDILEAGIFLDGQIEVLFNTKWPHTAPDSLARAMNSLAVAFIGAGSGIKVELEVLPFATIHTLQLHLNIDGYDLIFASCLSFCFCFIWSMPLLHMTLSKDGRYNYVELIAGMRTFVLILAFLTYDLLLVLFALFPINIAVIFFHWDLLMDANTHIYSVYVIFTIAVCVLSLNILIAILPIADMPFVYLKVLIAYSLGILVYIAVNELQPFADPNTAYFLLLDFHPFYALLHNLMRIASISEKIWLCSDRQIYDTSVYADQCLTIPNCCDDDAQEFYHFRYLCCVYLLTVMVWIAIFIFLKSHMVKRRPRQSKYFWDSDPDSKHDQNILHIMEPNELENTWILEKSRVSTLERNYIESKALHVEHLSVFFGLKAAIKRVDFMVNRYQVLSVFGANGTGKTVLLKAILGIYTPSSGRIITSNRVPFKSKGLDACHMVGYSAQEFRTMRSMTILETWELLLRIRRSRRRSLRADATELCKIFGLYKYRFKSLAICSQGVLKRLSIGIALISDAELILLDDPFTHLDIVSQRSMLHIIHDLRRRGHTVIYTCNDTEFSTPALRMATLSYPGIAVIGEREELQQNYYASYYMVETRIHIAELGSPIDFDTQSTEAKEDTVVATWEIFRHKHQGLSTACHDSEDRWRYLKLCGLIEKVFPHAIIKNVSFPRVCFWLSSHMYPMSKIVDTLHRNKQNFYSFSVSQPSVNSVFLSLAPQKMPKDTFAF